jgi:hypothetical protein
MSVRLSEDSVVASWDTGLQLPLLKTSDAPSLLSQDINLQKILESNDPMLAIQAIDRRDLYLAIKRDGLEESMEVLPHLSKEQFVAIIDYEGWHNDRLSVSSIISWLTAYKQLGLDQQFRRFQELDEEYQVAILNPYIDIADEDEYEKLSQDVQDQYSMLPCNTLWYRIKSDDARLCECVESLIQGGLGEDLAYTYSLLSHAARMPPHEQEELMRQFRNARIEEDGFALYEDSRSIFLPFDGRPVIRRWAKDGAISSHDEMISSLRLRPNSEGVLLDDVIKYVSTSGQYDDVAIENLQRSFGVLCNQVAGACNVTPGDLSELKVLLGHVRSIVSLGVELLAGRDLALASSVLISETPKVIFKMALSQVDCLRDKVLDVIKERNIAGYQEISNAWRGRKFGKTQWALDKHLIDTFDFETCESIKGMFNRFPAVLDTNDQARDAKRVRFKIVESVADLVSLDQMVNLLRDIVPIKSRLESSMSVSENN